MSNDLSELMQKLDQIEQQAKQEETATQESQEQETDKLSVEEADNELENTLRREFLGEPTVETNEEINTEAEVTVAEIEQPTDIIPQANETDAVGNGVYHNYEELAIHTTMDDLQNLAGLNNEK